LLQVLIVLLLLFFILFHLENLVLPLDQLGLVAKDAGKNKG